MGKIDKTVGLEYGRTCVEKECSFVSKQMIFHADNFCLLAENELFKN